MNPLRTYCQYTGAPTGVITFISKDDTDIKFRCSRKSRNLKRKIKYDSNGDPYFNYNEEKFYISDFNLNL